MMIVFLLVLQISLGFGQHESYVLKQRAIMLSQLQYERNLNLVKLDPETCSIPVSKEDRYRVLRANTQTLKKKGKLTHCKKMKFVGERAIYQRLREQKKVVDQYLNDLKAQNEGLITSQSSKVNPPKVIPKVKEPEVDTIPPQERSSEKIGVQSRKNFLGGYVGIPYFSISQEDESYSYKRNGQGLEYISATNLPEGITITDTHRGNLGGIPQRSGSFLVQVEAGDVGYYSKREPKFRGPVELVILPKPKHTVLNMGQRTEGAVNFLQAGHPSLAVSLNKSPYGSAWVRSLSPISTGKYYFEVKLLQKSEDQGICFSESAPSNMNEYPPKSVCMSGLKYKVFSAGGGKFGDWKDFKNGDILKAAIDVNEKKVWFGVNDTWSAHTLNWSMAYPGGALDPTATVEGFKEIWPALTGKGGAAMLANFGDQPWSYEPPKGFTGIPLGEIKDVPNMWDISSSSYHVATERLWRDRIEDPFYESDLLGLAGMSEQAYVLDGVGDKVIAMSPKKSGRWIFEIETRFYSHNATFGLAPVIFPEFKGTLGEEGSNGIGVRRLDEEASKTDKGLILINGKKTLIDRFDEKTRFTFDCDFDAKTVEIFADGKSVLKTPLPENNGPWIPAASLQSGHVQLYTHPIHIKYPVSGAKPWVLDK